VPTQSAWELLQADPDLTDFVQAIADADLVMTFDGTDPQPITVFAPTNDAIADIVDWSDVAADHAALTQFVLAHVVDGSFTADQLWALPVVPPATTPELTARSGDVLVIDAAAETINGVGLLAPVDPGDLPLDRPATNGMVHAVDTALVVPAVTPTTTMPPATPAPTEPPAPPTEPPAPPTEPPAPPPTA
jgi:uncharacterized surface protein with fasciclin (FAS1) repeats